MRKTPVRAAPATSPPTLAQARARAKRHPGRADSWVVLARLYLQQADLEQAQTAIEDGLRLAGRGPDLLFVRGLLHTRLGDLEAATRDYLSVHAMQPGHADAHWGLADVDNRQGRTSAALEHIDQALATQPDHRAARALRPVLLGECGRHEDAEHDLEALCRLEPNEYRHWNNLGNTLRQLGKLPQAVDSYLKSASLAQNDPIPLSNWLTTLHYLPEQSAESIRAASLEWGRRFTPEHAPTRPAPGDLDPARALRIGLISDGFRQHPVGAMTIRAFERLDRGQFLLHCYSTSAVVDHITKRFKTVASKWTDIPKLDGRALADLIRQDEIDILIDLSGHNAGNRMHVVAMEPAPLLVKWVGGLINTTGVKAIDYLISDAIETPPGCDAFYTEKLIRLPDDYICYMPPPRTPAVAELPAMRNGYVTFGCFNNPTKINAALLAEWATLMHAVPHSRLFLKGSSYDSSTFREKILAILDTHGIAPDRVRLEGKSPHFALLQAYNDVDIALDPWPYSGGLTTCEAMLMGVPVITLPGPTFAGRHSATHLVNAGMPELVVDSWDEYRQRALGLAGDLQTLATIRAHMRQVFMASPICDAARFGRSLGVALRAIWQRHCEGRPPAALTLDSDGQACFDGEAGPIALVREPIAAAAESQAPDGTGAKDFQFSFKGPVATVDHGGVLAGSEKYRQLAALGGLATLAFDPAGSLASQDVKPIDCKPHVALGDGSRGTLFACLDSSYSGTLEPLPAAERALATARALEVLARIPVPTVRLDDVEGMSGTDWLVLDDLNDNVKILEGAARHLDNALFVQARIRFATHFSGQASLADICSILARHGFELLDLRRPKYLSCYGESVHLRATRGAQLLSADAVFIPCAQRLSRLDANQSLKMAFVAHAWYGYRDLAARLLSAVDGEMASQYLECAGTPPAGGRQADVPSALARRPVPEPTDGVTPALRTTVPPAAASVSGRPGSKPDGEAHATAQVPQVPDEPHMEEPGRNALREHLARSNVFLEYGSGGSSVMACARGQGRVYSVDSDLAFLQAVRARIDAQGHADRYVPIYVDIGATGAWGVPTDIAASAKWPGYMKAPWRHMDEAGDTPDLVLIDGRFRVACFAITLLLARPGCVILFDDYYGRPGYHVAERHLKPHRRHGRMAEFIVPDTRPDGLVDTLLHYCTTPA